MATFGRKFSDTRNEALNFLFCHTYYGTSGHNIGCLAHFSPLLDHFEIRGGLGLKSLILHCVLWGCDPLCFDKHYLHYLTQRLRVQIKVLPGANLAQISEVVKVLFINSSARVSNQELFGAFQKTFEYHVLNQRTANYVNICEFLADILGICQFHFNWNKIFLITATLFPV